MKRMAHPAHPRVLVTVAVLAGLAAGSGEVGPVRAAALPHINLVEALTLAESRNPDHAALRARAEAQDLRRSAAARASWPRLSLVSDLSRADAPARVFAEKLGRGTFGAADFEVTRLNDPSGIGHLGSALALEVPVDLAGTNRARTRTEEAAARGLAAQVAEARQELRLRVTDAFARAALADAALLATRRALDGARAREEMLQARVSEGAALRADLLRVRTRRRQREADVARARGDEQAALVALARALGTDGIEYRPAAPLTGVGEADGTIDSWRARARAGRGLAMVAAERRSVAEWSRRAEQRALLPTVAGYVSAFDDRWSGASQRSYALGATLRWTFEPAQRRRIAAAEAEERVAGFEQRAAAAQVDAEVETAWARLSAAREALAAAQGGTEDGREALRVVRERRAAGLATLTDELETEAAALAAELDELRARTDLALAEAHLRRAAGVL
jgi:outer membrane protein